MSALRPIVVMLVAGSLSACSGYSPKSNFSLPSVLPTFGSDASTPEQGKATVLLSSSIQDLSCAEKRIVLAQADAEGFRTVRQERVVSVYDGGTGAAVMDLDPGTYHIVEIACRNGANVVHAGTNPAPGAVPWQAERWTRSLASFALAPGEVLDAGELVLTAAPVTGFGAGIDGRKADLAVRPSPEPALAEIVRTRPEIAPKLHTFWMTIAQGPAVVLAKCHLQSPKKALPKDGSSKVPDAIAAHPEAKSVIDSIGWATTDSKACLHEGGAINSLLGAAAAKQ